MNLADHVRAVPDFPKPGVMFRDLTPLLAHGPAFAETTRQLAERAAPFDAIAGIEARGFLFGAALAQATGRGLLIVRKAGKLPPETIGHAYQLEYGEDRLEIRADVVTAGQRVLLVDDVLATGGTAEAAVHLLRSAGALVEQGLFVIDLPGLGGSQRLAAAGVRADALLCY